MTAFYPEKTSLPFMVSPADLVTVTDSLGVERIISRPELESGAPTLSLYRWTGLSWLAYCDRHQIPHAARKTHINRAEIEEKQARPCSL